MNEWYIGQKWAFIVLFSSGLGCGSERSELIYEDVILQLPPTVEVTTTVIGNSCAGSSGLASGVMSTVSVLQDGNDLSWRAKGSSDDSLDLEFIGRVCALDGDGFELRMRSEAVIRVADEDGFCRTTLRAPDSFGRCGAFESLCDDDATIKLAWHDCTGTFNGRFSTQLSYTEACLDVGDCKIDIEMEVRLPSSRNRDCDTPVVNEDVNCASASQCVCAETN
jgi:hypothetical protein